MTLPEAVRQEALEIYKELKFATANDASGAFIVSLTEKFMSLCEKIEEALELMEGE